MASRNAFRITESDVWGARTDPSWAAARPPARLAFWREVGRLAIARRKLETRRKLDAAGSEMMAVKRAWGDPRPMIPHREESRAQSRLQATPTNDGVSIHWGNFSRVIGYHKAGIRRADAPGGIVVRDLVGLTPAGLKYVAMRARQRWRQDHPLRPAPPKPAPVPWTPTKTTRQVDTRTSPLKWSGATTPRAKPRPKTIPPAAEASATPTATATATPATLDPTIKANLKSAARAIKAEGVQVVPLGGDALDTLFGDKARLIPAAYSSKGKVIYLNERHPYWADPGGVMARANRKRPWFSTSEPEHIVTHELGHARHDAASGADYERHRKADWGPGEREAIAGEVSEYGASKPVELVAEVYAGLKAGRVYDEAVMRLYRIYGGPTP